MVTQAGIRRALLIAALLGTVTPCVAQDALWEMWSGIFARDIRPQSAFDFSYEYQARLQDDMSALKVHYVEFNALYKANNALVVNSGYRFSIRPDRNEHRLFAGLFYRYAFRKGKEGPEDRRPLLTQQLMYQRDFNAKFNDVLLDSSTLRYALYFEKRVGYHWVPLAVAGAMYTWNSEFTGLEKLRAAVGVRYIRNNGDRFQVLFVREKGLAVEPKKYANIVWLRYEVMF